MNDVSTFQLRRDGVACSDLGSEIVILDLDTSSYYSASNSAAVLLGALVDGASREDLVERLVTTYDVDVDEADIDVEAFLDGLRKRNLLEEVAC
jgi:hypothetical protein